MSCACRCEICDSYLRYCALCENFQLASMFKNKKRYQDYEFSKFLRSRALSVALIVGAEEYHPEDPDKHYQFLQHEKAACLQQSRAPPASSAVITDPDEETLDPDDEKLSSLRDTTKVLAITARTLLATDEIYATASASNGSTGTIPVFTTDNQATTTSELPHPCGCHTPVAVGNRWSTVYGHDSCFVMSPSETMFGSCDVDPSLFSGNARHVTTQIQESLRACTGRQELAVSVP